MMARTPLRQFGSGLALSLALVFVAGAGPAPETVAATPSRYVDPQARFSLMIPAAAELTEQAEPTRIQIASPKGYRISLQTGHTDSKFSLADMARRLEEQYVSPSGPWTSKRGQRQTTVAGLAALETVYEGARQRSRVVIMRGQDNDFVLVFSSAPTSYDALGREFDAVLASFQVGAPAADTAKAAPSNPAMAAAPTPTARRKFNDDALGFALDIPGDWAVERPSPFTVVFSGESGRDSYFTTVSIQNIDGSSVPDTGKRVSRVLADLRAGLDRRAKDVRFVGDASYAYDHRGVHLDGRQVLVDYMFQGQRFRQWTLVVPRAGASVVHVWSYTAPAAQFDATRPAAEAMLKSWTLNDPPAGRS